MSLFYRILRKVSFRHYLSFNVRRVEQGKNWIQTKKPV